MRWILFFITVLLFSLLSISFGEMNLILLLVISISVLKPEREAFILAFLTGIILDLVANNTLGLSSLLFLFMALIISLYRKKFSAKNYLFLYVFSLIGLIINNAVLGKQSEIIIIFNSLLIFPIFLIVFFWNQYYFREIGYKLGV